jgi:hypothetical protein
MTHTLNDTFLSWESAKMWIDEQKRGMPKNAVITQFHVTLIDELWQAAFTYRFLKTNQPDLFKETT